MQYFAYGANLNKRAMARRCPSATAMGVATLPGYKLCFRRFADIEPSVGNDVLGVVWTLTPACERALDQYEGPDYRKCDVEVEINGQLIKAFAYVMKDQSRTAPPSMEYYRELVMGYQDWSFDEARLRRARYDILRVGAPAQPKAEIAPQTRPRRALWDPAQQTSGVFDPLSVRRPPKR